MKNFLRFILLILTLIFGIYLGYKYNENIGRFIDKDKADDINIADNTELIKNTNTIIENDEISNLIITFEDEEYISKTKKGFIAVSNKRNIPKIKSKNNQKAADNIVKELIEISDNYWDAVKEQSDEYTTDQGDQIKNDSDIGVSYIFSTGFTNDKIISFVLETSGSMGGVGWNGYEVYNFDVNTGEKLLLKDISIDYSETIDFISSEMEKHVKAEGLYDGVKEYVEVMENSSLRQEIEKYMDSGIWYFENNSFKVSMPKYSIGNGAMGIITCSIDVKKINEYLKSEYKM